MLGCANDNPEILRTAADYLVRTLAFPLLHVSFSRSPDSFLGSSESKAPPVRPQTIEVRTTDFRCHCGGTKKKYQRMCGQCWRASVSEQAA
jgi:hypothetical protein